ncbi:TonB family protein [Neolewinella xylanilytica]|uniref:TonB family protein n=1 Tax=Neolewinella xylanilytica TaxID=1514080 RepID=A0A2S6I093_9BACT|nr:energy transducer TonB [Neolewinella xylanilytica]PPK84269.1 TonB family protein [Neolewinella xylanilytica]
MSCTSLKLLICIALLICLAPALVAQKGDRRFKGRYESDLGQGKKELASAYQWMTSVTADKQYVRRTYFPETHQLIGHVTFADKKMRVNNGPARKWFDEGGLRSEVTFVHGLEEGIYVDYHRNGAVASTGTYRRGQKTGTWLHYRNDGTLYKSANYRAGKLDGPSIRIDSLAGADTIYYRQDQLVDAAGETLETSDPGPMELMPLFPGCEEFLVYSARKPCADRKMLEFVYRHIQYPPRAREMGVEGTAVVSFVIERDGSVSEITSEYGLNEDVRTEIVRLVNMMPVWEPGIQDGIPVRVLFTLPVKFGLR